MAIAGFVCLAIALFLTLTAVYSAVCYIICALMLKPEDKPNEFSFSVHWIFSWGVSAFVLAGALFLYYA